jgi:hypothetical protein
LVGAVKVERLEEDRLEEDRLEEDRLEEDRLEEEPLLCDFIIYNINVTKYSNKLNN